MPVLTIFAGPNGSGKSSIIRRVYFDGRGGHHVPDNDVRRRYARSLSNLRQVVNFVNETIGYDNSGPEPRLIFEIRSSNIVSKANELPSWARDLLAWPGDYLLETGSP